MAAVQTLTWDDAWTLAPEIVLSLFTILLILLDLFLPKRTNRDLIGWLSIAGLVAAAACVLFMIDLVNGSSSDSSSGVQILLGGSYVVDDFGNLLKLAFLGAAALIVLGSLGTVKDDQVPIKGEMYYLVLPAVLGAMVMSSSGDLITMFVGLELLSITSYILVAVRKRNRASGEAAFKYVVTGGVASAFILYGMSFLYGITGATNVTAIRESLASMQGGFDALLYIAFFLMIAGFAVKLALAPFHAWAADVYQGAPTPVTAFLGVVAKGAAFAMLYRIFVNTIYALGQSNAQIKNDLLLALSVLAAAAMIVGTTGALRQRNLKRLLALSGVANAGILLIPLTTAFKTEMHADFFSEFLFYLLAYVFMNVGAFTVLTVVGRSSGSETLSSFAGLYHRSPWIAVSMTVLLCSLAGLPVTGGFFGKLYILFGTAQTHDYWIGAILLVTTIVSYAVYFGIIRQMYLRSGSVDGGLEVPAASGIVIGLCVIATLALGVFPSPVMSWIHDTFSVFSDQSDLFMLLR
ncbi:NADH-quinone oxidoreductase subunit N [Cohnella suwonensis]|uniref:NADH-quinone oxidoreductase subunit N n=1 Tax=Cohnella suwonensis TaxID=696072 RepID=A0ABW0LV94_9BACL